MDSALCPLPGQPVRGSRTGKPIMALLDLLGRTWALGILWNLRSTPATFRLLQQRCEHISPTLLNRRLQELQQAQLVDKGEQGYQLSPLGHELLHLILPMGQWAQHWASQLQQGACDV